MSISPDFPVTSFMKSWGNAKFLPDVHKKGGKSKHFEWCYAVDAP
jgi:hypothetical protein